MRRAFPANIAVNVWMVALFMALATNSAWATDRDLKDIGPKDVVEGFVNDLVQVLKDREDVSTITEVDREKIRKVVHGRMDYREMSKRSLGRAWKSISEHDRVHFTDLFRRLLERSYSNRLSSFRDQETVFGDAQFKRDKARIKTTVIDTDKDTPVEYRLHQTAAGWQIYDIRIEGVSLISNFRTDFREKIKRSGGFKELVHALEKKLEKLEAKDRPQKTPVPKALLDNA